MKRYIDLRIEGTKEELKGFLSKMKTVRDADFVFSKERTNGLALNLSTSINEVGCFLFIKDKDIYARVLVNINNSKKDESYVLWISNIIPSRNIRLSIEGYNSILKDFIKRIVEKCVPIDRINLSKEEEFLSDKISSQSYKALTLWESTVDHNLPFSHPLDKEKWMSFISSVYYYKDFDKMNGDDLERWLKEDMNWGNGFFDVIEEVVDKYQYGIDLLQYYSNNYKFTK